MPHCHELHGRLIHVDTKNLYVPRKRRFLFRTIQMARSVPWQRVGADAGLGTASGSKAVAKTRTSKLSLEWGASIVEIPESMGRTFASASPQNA